MKRYKSSVTLMLLGLMMVSVKIIPNVYIAFFVGIISSLIVATWGILTLVKKRKQRL